MTNLTNNLEAMKQLIERLSPGQIQKLATFSIFSVAMLKGLEIMLADSDQTHI